VGRAGMGGHVPCLSARLPVAAGGILLLALSPPPEHCPGNPTPLRPTTGSRAECTVEAGPQRRGRAALCDAAYGGPEREPPAGRAGALRSQVGGQKGRAGGSVRPKAAGAVKSGWCGQKRPVRSKVVGGLGAVADALLDELAPWKVGDDDAQAVAGGRVRLEALEPHLIG
jgi:hypothetical protein